MKGFAGMGDGESPGSQPQALRQFPVRLLFGLRLLVLATVGRAAAFTLAGIFTLAALVARLAAALAFTGVFTAAGMFFALLRHCLEGDSG